MAVYIVLFIMLCMITFLDIGQKQAIVYLNIKRIIPLYKNIYLPLLLLLFIGIFRETSVGYDADSYYTFYWSRVDYFTWGRLFTDFSLDNGFYILLKIIAVFTDEWWMARAILFSLTFIIYYAVISKETPYQSLSMIIFLGVGMLGLLFGIFRQVLAGAIVMIAYNQLRKKSWIKCVIFILIATTFHKTALICFFMIPLYFARTKKFSGIELIVTSAVSYILFSVAIPVITFFYANARYTDIAKSDGGYGKLLFLIVVIVLVDHLFRITKTCEDEEMIFLFNLSCSALFLQMGALQWSLLTRATVFFSIYWSILIPKLISKLPRQRQVPYCILIIILFGFMFFYQFSAVDVFVMHKF